MNLLREYIRILLEQDEAPKVVFMAGGPGSGKSTVIRQLGLSDRLDVINPDEGKRANEVKQKFNAQCGTPLFIDAETGNSVCGFREKDILEKWAKGENASSQNKGL